MIQFRPNYLIVKLFLVNLTYQVNFCDTDELNIITSRAGLA